MPEPQNTTQSPPSDNATPADSLTSLAPELGPNGLPISPPQGEAPPQVDNDLIMDTFFGDGQFEPNPDGGQAKEPKPTGGQESKGSLAPPAPAPAANGGEGSSQPEPSPTQQSGQQQEPPAGGGAAQTPGQGSQPSPEPQPSAGLSPEDRLALASVGALRDQNAQLIAELTRLRSGGQPQPQPTGQPGSQPQPTQQPGAGQEPLRLVVPEDLYAGIMNDDPAVSRQSLSVLVSAVAQNAVQATLARVPALIDERMQTVTQTLEQSKEVQKMEEQYFERFPAHKNELFKSLIQQVVDEKYQQFPHAKWDELMMDAVGSTVNAKLQQLGIDPTGLQKLGNEPAASQPNGNGQPQPTPQKPQPAPMLDASTRGKVPEDSGDFIKQTFM